MKNKTSKKSNNLIKLNELYLSENETLSMVKRYKFDQDSVQEILKDVQKTIDELNILQEQKEYEEMNYYAIYRRMSQYSIFEVIKILFKYIISISTR